jgi:hypothetical protein
MACAYNVEPLVEKLISSGADCNTMNCFGYSPLLEACHRGYLPVVQLLVNGGADLTHVPPDSMSNQSPFAAAPAHSALGEAARCGFTKIVTLLLESGAKVNATNSLGWTPLHEAVFYNRRDVAAALLDAGADATLRTRSGALPYHLSGLEEVRALLASHGGPRAIPGDGDTVNMLDILHEITVGAAHESDGGGEQPVFTLQLVEGDDDDYGEEEEDGDDEVFRLMQLMSGDMGLGYDPDDKDVFDDDYEDRLLDTTHQVKPSHSDVDAGDKGTPRREARGPAIDRDIRQYDADDKTSEPALLHSGAMLGNLPALRGTASPEAAVQRSERDLHEALRYGDGSKTKKKGKKTNKKPKATTAPDIPADIPTKFLCQLSQRPMQEPVQSIYGHIYEHYTILQWFQQQGQICPLTGAPLSATDLKAMPELAEQIMQWVLQRGSAQASAPEPANVPVPTGPTNPSTSNDDLYDF